MRRDHSNRVAALQLVVVVALVLADDCGSWVVVAHLVHGSQVVGVSRKHCGLEVELDCSLAAVAAALVDRTEIVGCNRCIAANFLVHSRCTLGFADSLDLVAAGLD